MFGCWFVGQGACRAALNNHTKRRIARADFIAIENRATRCCLPIDEHGGSWSQHADVTAICSAEDFEVLILQRGVTADAEIGPARFADFKDLTGPQLHLSRLHRRQWF